MTRAELIQTIEELGTTQAELARRAGFASRQSLRHHLIKCQGGELPPELMDRLTPVLRELQTEQVQRAAGALTD